MNISRRLLFALLLPLLVLLNATAVFAQPDKSITPLLKTAETLNTEQVFDAATANKSLALLRNTVPSGKNGVTELQTAILVLNKFQQQAKKCVDTNTALLDRLNQRLTEITSIASTLQQSKDAALSEERKYLNSKKEELGNQLSECRLFSLRAEEVATSLTQKRRDLVTTWLLYAHPNILANLSDIFNNLDKTWKAFDREMFENESGITFFKQENTPLLLLPLLIILAVFYSNNRVKKKIVPLIGETTEISFSRRIKQALVAILSRYLPVFTGTIVLAIFFSTFTHSLVTPSYLALSSYAFLVYLLYLSLVRFYFYPPPPAEGFTSLPKPMATIMARRLSKLGILSLVTYILYISLGFQNIERPVVDVFRTIIITLFSINLISIAWVMKSFPALDFKHILLRFLSRFFLISYLLFVLATEYLGYHLLAFYLIFGAVMTVIITFFTKLLDKLIIVVFDTLKGTDHPWQQKLRSSFGLKRNERLIEALWLQALLRLMLWLGFLIAILKIWGLAQANFQIFINYLLYGFDIGKLHLDPSRILAGALFFIILVLVTRWFRTYINKNGEWQLEAGSRESLASIVGYVGFAVAFILGALIAGVNFSGLALAASALAVGIGFGLQSIVNNFVSGIILLIERPIKLGDRIVIGHTEGYVKKISIRSTHITTSQCSDVIVPNSELIAQQVTNYMLHDMNYKISTPIGIAYGSDTDLAKNILLSIAKTHPQVITNRKDMEPAVYFKTFGESSLNFELHCIIKDVNERANVISDLNFAIDKAFKEKGIGIAFPQRDIRIKEWPQDANKLQHPN